MCSKVDFSRVHQPLRRLPMPRRQLPPLVVHVCVSPPVRRFITESVCACQQSSCHAPLLQRPPTQNVDYGACASVSWPCMCVSARFEGLLQSVCVSQLSSCVPLSSHARLLKTLIKLCVLRSAGHACVCQPGSKVYYRECV